ncbi:helix-turn-helix domain-containing protein [Nocardia pseudobrasiliensis]|nr:helix-turn-helix transcriptional regulator [Nocardia pseudobrasiliensis]
MALGRQLQKFRERAGLSQNAVARAVEMSPQTYGRLEDGVKQNLTTLLTNALCDTLSVSAEERRQLHLLAEEVRKQHKSGERGWWRPYIDDLEKNFAYYLQLEGNARKITYLHLNLVPGLLQTTEYRRQLVWAEFPQRSPEEIDRFIQVVVQRQKRLTDSQFELEVFVPEIVLRRPIGGPGVMEDQLHHLAEVGQLPNVSIRVIRDNRTNPMILVADSFNFMTFPPLPNTKLTPPPVVYKDGFTGALYLIGEKEVAKYREVISILRRVALDEGATRDLVLTIAREFSS